MGAHLRWCSFPDTAVYTRKHLCNDVRRLGLTQIEVNDTLGLPIVTFGVHKMTMYAHLLVHDGSGSDEHGGASMHASLVLAEEFPIANDFVVRVADEIEQEFDRGVYKHTYWPEVAWRGWLNFEGRFDWNIPTQVRPV